MFTAHFKTRTHRYRFANCYTLKVPHCCGKAPFGQPVLKLPLFAYLVYVCHSVLGSTGLWPTACRTCSGYRVWEEQSYCCTVCELCTAALSSWRYREQSRTKGSILTQNIYLLFVDILQYSYFIWQLYLSLPAGLLSSQPIQLPLPPKRAHKQQLLDQTIWKKCLCCKRLGYNTFIYRIKAATSRDL